MTGIPLTVAALVTEALSQVDSVTFQPPEFTHRETRARMHRLVDALAARAPLQAPQPGWVCVPLEPTSGMIDAFHALLAAVPPIGHTQ